MLLLDSKYPAEHPKGKFDIYVNEPRKVSSKTKKKKTYFN